MPNEWEKVKSFVMDGGYEKLLKPSVRIHGTVFPQTQYLQEKLGVRFDFSGTVTK